MEMIVLGQKKKRYKRKGPAPFAQFDPSLSRVESFRLWSWYRGLVPGQSLKGSGCEVTWNYP